MKLREEIGWKEAADSISGGLVMVDPEGRIVRCNPAASQLIELPVEEIVGRPAGEVLGDLPLPEVIRDGQSRPSVPCRIGGRPVLAGCSPICREGEIAGAVCVFQDMTDIQRMISELDRKDKEISQFKEIFERVYDGIVIVDSNNRITMISQSYCDFLEVDHDEAIGRPVTDIIENSRLHVVMKTGQAEIGAIMKVKGRDIMVMRLPIKKEGKVVGAIGKVMFTNLHDVQTLAKRISDMESKLDYYKSELKRVHGSKYTFDQIIGEHEKMKEAKELAMKAAASRSTVLIRGESGTGKELFAHAIHSASRRSDGPFIRVNCAAIPAELMEAELFGYEEGAFTGAKKGGKPGKIELAQGGTLFLDEIGEMPPTMQVKLLRVLQEREIERIGGTVIKQVDIRVIAATHRPLEDMVKRGQFREDLYYRLNVFSIVIPALRERGDDILATAYFLLSRLTEELGVNVSRFHPEVERFMMRYPWPGNVREMQNVIERSLHLADGPEIGMEHLPPFFTDAYQSEPGTSLSLLEAELEKTELRVIRQVLKECGGNRNQAARRLGIHRASLYRKLEKYGLMQIGTDVSQKSNM